MALPARGFEALLEETPVLADGAWGTELRRRGLGAGGCADLWNLENPGAVEEVARAYVEAGSRIILTNTFQASRPALARRGLVGRTAEINRAGAAISRRAAGASAAVFAAMGPTGVPLPGGEDEVSRAFAEQAGLLAEGGADALLIETLSDPAEARLAVRAALGTGLPVVASFTFGRGTAPEEAAREMEAAGARAVGANCGADSREAPGICRRLRAATRLPLWAKPNAGLPLMRGDEPVYPMTPEEFARLAAELAEAGASFVGGCCGAGPDFIRAAAQALRK